MSTDLGTLCDRDLLGLITALQTRRLCEPYSDLQISRVVSPAAMSVVSELLSTLKEKQFCTQQIATLLEMVLADRTSRPKNDQAIDLVTSGPESSGATTRDTSVVVRQMFHHAKQSVMVIGYAVHQGQQVFESLAERMSELPDLQVRFYLNIARPDHDRTPATVLVSRFVQHFKDNQWPTGHRLPVVFFDPRSVSDNSPVRSSLHAKCIVVDGEEVFVSSANFSEAGQQRNIEVGLKIDDVWLARRLTNHFYGLEQAGIVRQAL